MARFRNDFGEDRVVPTLGYVLVPEGDIVSVPDDEWHHWEAGGWTPLDPDPRPPVEPEADPAPQTAPEPEPMAEAATDAQEAIGDGDGTALPPVDPEDPGPHTAPAEETDQ